MKMCSCKQLWKGFCEFLETVDSENISTLQFITDLISWLKSNRKAFPVEVWDSYRLDQFMSMELERYDVEFNEGNVHATVVRLHNQYPSSKDNIAMYIRDVLWDCIIYKTDVTCPNCEGADLSTMISVESGETVFTCDLCYWSQDEQGYKCSGKFNLRFAEKEDIKKLKLKEYTFLKLR